MIILCWITTLRSGEGGNFLIRIINTEPKVLGEYKNGNYKVTIYENGTKIRETFDENVTEFVPVKPECMDVKITNCCDRNCKMCHEDSKIDGEHGEVLGLKFWDSLLPYTEIALGGGNPLSHPDLVTLLLKLKKLKLIPNMTVNQVHFMENKEFIRFLCNEKLIYGLGVSLTDANDAFIKEIQKFPNAVIHIINGIVTKEELEKLANKNLKVLILGYKTFRRGEKYFEINHDKVVELKSMLYDYLPKMLNKFKVVSFDNLALEQLNVRRLLTEEEWNNFYMGNDGNYTMYIDLVKQNFAMSSVSTERFDLLDDIEPMFNKVRGVASLNEN